MRAGTGARICRPGSLWLCLSLDGQDTPVLASPGYTHYAFSIASADFAPFAARLRAAGVPEWQQNRSAGDSLYFLDPDGHRLEAHAGSLAQRLAACRAAPYAGMQFFDAKGIGAHIWTRTAQIPEKE